MQIIATILCSVAVVMFTAMLFRPEEGGFGSVKFLGMIAIILMGLYAFFQMIAFSLVVGLEKDYDVFSPGEQASLLPLLLRNISPSCVSSMPHPWLPGCVLKGQG